MHVYPDKSGGQDSCVFTTVNNDATQVQIKKTRFQMLTCKVLPT